MNIVDLINLVKESNGYKSYSYIHTGNDITRTNIDLTHDHFTYYEEAGKNFNYKGYINFNKNILYGILNFKDENRPYYSSLKYEDEININNKVKK